MKGTDMTAYEDDLDLEALKERLREQASRRRQDLHLKTPLPAPTAGGGWTFNWLDVKCRLEGLREVQVGALPVVEQMGRLKRLVIRTIARIGLFLVRPLVTRQTHLNTCFIDLFGEVGRSLQDTENRVVQHQEWIRLLEAQVTELQFRLNAVLPHETGRKAS
jgi:hypothetical protein